MPKIKSPSVWSHGMVRRVAYDSTCKYEECCQSIKSEHDYALNRFHEAGEDSDGCKENTGSTAESAIIE